MGRPAGACARRSGESRPVEAAVVLPARLASTRLPGKLLLARTGKPLLSYAVEKALAAKRRSERPGSIVRVTRVIVATDSRGIAEAARASGAEAVLTSRAHRSGTDRIVEVARALREPIVVNVQADEPEVEPAAILKLAAILAAEPGAPMATLAARFRGKTAERILADPNAVKVVLDRQGRALYFSRAGIPHRRDPRGRAEALLHLGLYAYRREFLLRWPRLPRSRLEATERLEQLRALEAGVPVRVGLVPRAHGGIDTERDYAAFVRRARARAGRRARAQAGNREGAER